MRPLLKQPDYNSTIGSLDKNFFQYSLKCTERRARMHERPAMHHALLVDCHTHTSFSDGVSTLEENFAAAEAAGVSLIACTDHFAHPAFMDCAIDESRIPEYESLIVEARERHPKLEIVLGFEADWYEGCEPDIERFRGNASFILGSIHYLDEFAIDWKEDMRIWEREGANGVWERYAHDWCRACFCPHFDSMAHPDLPRLFSAEGYAPTRDLAPLWDNMAEAAHEAGVHVELSTAGLRKSFRDFYPQRELLERFARAGVPLTVGSDAHKARHIGAGISEAYRLAYETGYRFVDAPRAEGGWRRIEL